MERIGGKDRTSVFLSLLSWTKGLLQIFSRRSNCYGWQLQSLQIWPQSFPSNRRGKAKSCKGSVVREFCVWTRIDLSQRYTKVNMRSCYLRAVSQEEPPADQMKHIAAVDHTHMNHKPKSLEHKKCYIWATIWSARWFIYETELLILRQESH